MADQDQRFTLRFQLTDYVLHLLGFLHPKRSGGLVHNRQFGMKGGRAGNRHTLSLPAGHFLNGVVNIRNFHPGFFQGR